MNEYWKNLISPWWPSPIGASLGLSAGPAQPVDEPSRSSWPMTAGLSPWMPPAPLAPSLPQGGLLSSLDAGTSGGLFGRRLTPPVPHVDSVGYWGAMPVPSRPGATPMIGSNYSPSPVPRSPDWDAIPSRAPATMAPLLLEPVDRPPRGVSAENSKALPTINESAGGFQDDREVMSDVTPDNDWIPNARYVGDGHHHAPQAIYEKLPLPKETRRVFRKGTTGALPLLGWHQNDKLHRAYNDAVEELIYGFMQDNNIKPDQMTPDQARSILKAIAESEEPRIRAYRDMLRKMWMLYRLRTGGRGTE